MSGKCCCIGCDNTALIGNAYCAVCIDKEVDWDHATPVDDLEEEYGIGGDWNPDQSDEDCEVLSGRDMDIECYHNVFKDIHGGSPHHMDFDAMSDDEIQVALKALFKEHDAYMAANPDLDTIPF